MSNTSLLSYLKQFMLPSTCFPFCREKYKYFAGYLKEIVQQKENKGVDSLPHLLLLLQNDKLPYQLKYQEIM